MLGARQSLYDGCLLTMRVNGVIGDSQTPYLGLRQGLPLCATLSRLFIDGLHHYLETAVPTTGFQTLQMRLRELVYADDICLLASLPEQLQALIDALAACCATMQMEISVPKTKVMVVSSGNTINLHLHLLQAILLPVLQDGCQTWGMHSPHIAAANDACATLQRLYDYYLRTICHLLPSTPRRLFLIELGLLPLQVC